MALIPRLELRQSQSLVMTPQLQQAIKLLQLNNLELMEYVERELEQNPLLEREETTAETPSIDDGGGEAAAGEKTAEIDDGGLRAVDTLTGDAAQVSADEALDIDYDNQWDRETTVVGPRDAPGSRPDPAFSEWGPGGGGGGGGGGFDGNGPNLEETISGKISLRDHLSAQLSIDIHDPVDRMIGVHLIDMLNSAGYIAGDLDAVADILGCGRERLENTLTRLQAFDPPGIFARDLKECLRIQLADRDRLDPAMEIFLDNLDLLARRELGALGKVCGVDAEDITDMAAEIRGLNPKPALAFDHTVAQPVTPDVFIRTKPGGGWIVELNSATLPRVLVNNIYHVRLSRTTNSREDRKYISDCLQTANWLVKSLHQRATTILKVSTEIIRQQNGFFKHGIQSLKPLVLRDIADVIEMHESTVSRVTSNKYMATPRGIFELKYFFTPAIASSVGGEAHSAESVRHRIKELVFAEDPKKILSDDKIVALLRNEGVDIARRTVAKYRRAMAIPSSFQRRREKAVIT
ncbi:MAG TPA: RNA polymerase sigma-54 factor [Alphaproteobacteria bacterium]|nr:RNA polymerase sigma-54 factor [Alphaproteobacteria bacterium]